jgi:hypothetical protein
MATHAAVRMLQQQPASSGTLQFCTPSPSAAYVLPALTVKARSKILAPVSYQHPSSSLTGSFLVPAAPNLGIEFYLRQSLTFLFCFPAQLTRGPRPSASSGGHLSLYASSAHSQPPGPVGQQPGPADSRSG